MHGGFIHSLAPVPGDTNLKILALAESMQMGGTANETISLCKQLWKLGHGVTIASNGGRLVEEIEHLGMSHYSLPVIRGQRTTGSAPEWRVSLLSFPYCLLKLLRVARKEQSELVHAHLNLVPILLGYLISRILKIPLVVTLNDGILVHPSKLFVLKSLGLFASTDKLVVMTAQTQSLVLGLGTPDHTRHKMDIIPCSVDLDDFSSDRSFSSVDIPARISYQDKVVLWVGRLDRDKIDAVRTLVFSATQIITRVPHVRILIVGSGKKYRQVRTMADELNKALGKEVVVVAGFLADVIHAMKSADVVVAMGRTVIEAMACRKPVIIVGHFAGPFGGNFGGILTEKNAQRLREYNYSGRDSMVRATPGMMAEACVKLLTDDTYCQSLGEIGRHIVETEHSAPVIAKRVERLYQEAVRARAAQLR